MKFEFQIRGKSFSEMVFELSGRGFEKACRVHSNHAIGAFDYDPNTFSGQVISPSGALIGSFKKVEE